jgi:hypothetical protein
MADELGRWQAFRGVDGRKEHRQGTVPSRCLSILAGVTSSTLQKWYHHGYFDQEIPHNHQKRQVNAAQKSKNG